MSLLLSPGPYIMFEDGTDDESEDKTKHKHMYKTLSEDLFMRHSSRQYNGNPNTLSLL